MAVRNPRTRYRIVICILFLLPLLLYIFSVFSSPSNTIPINDFHTREFNPKVDYSFVTSLEKFLTSKNQRSSRAISDDDTVAATVTDEDVRKLDDLMWKRENDRIYDPAFSSLAALSVYVYEMPSKFTLDLLWLFRNTYKHTSNLTSNGSPVHRLIQQHSIDYWLWADLIAPESERLLKNVVRVYRQEEADLFYIPFFTTISFFLMEKQQCKALYRVKL